ncbi:hypothetical protein DRN97_04660 [Methanosarcinales archaeon]|nr:MAG: hypothetical protein DRN97_04660 [Methanosarcinales archaeon]
MKQKDRDSKKVLNSPMVRGMVALFVVMTFVLLATPAAAQEVEVRVWVNAPAYVGVGETFDAIINVGYIKDFKAGQFGFFFNSTVVNVTDVKDGRLGETTIPVEGWEFVDKDAIRVTFDIPGDTGVSGSGYLAKICFEVKGIEGDRSILNRLEMRARCSG